MQTELHAYREREVFDDAVSCQDYVASIVDEQNVSTEHWWNYTERKAKVLGEKPVPLLHACSLYFGKVAWISESTEYMTDSSSIRSNKM
jgi:hypothetical protein